MKHFCIFLTILFSDSVFSQNQNELSYGLKFGANYSMIVQMYEDLGFYGGGFINQKLNEKTSLQGEILFSNTENIYFLELPVLVKYEVINSIYVSTGPRINLLLNDEKSYNEKLDETIDVFSFKKFGIGWEIGIQKDICNGLFLESRFNYNFTKQIQETFYEDYYNSRINTIRFGIGYRF